MQSLGLVPADFFLKEHELIKKWILQRQDVTAGLSAAMNIIQQSYTAIQSMAEKADVTLMAHVAALQKQAEKKLLQLEKKMIRAHKRKYAVEVQLIESLLDERYPNGALQERVENYFGLDIMDDINWLNLIYSNSKTMDQEFCIIQLQ